MKRRLLALSLIVAALFLLSGCLSTTERTVKDKAGNKATIDKKNVKVKIKDKNGETSAELGGSGKLPKGFPRDVPIYKGAKIKTSISTKNEQGNGQMVTIEANSTLKKVGDFYMKELSSSGYKSTGKFSQDNLLTIIYEKDNVSVTVIITQLKDKTSANINVLEK
ncbi:MAG TPA: hypothetical protein ENH19_01085 [Actinobacteria bacterium]|nr:hypothetical protein [Actinomycetes bacterium]HEX21231.1 hypothetical protein [Actinomycetota bacterium]